MKFIVFILLFLVGCDSGLSRQDAERLIHEANTLESQGQPVAAYRKYKLVEGLYETNGGLRSFAWDGAQRARMAADGIAAGITETIKEYYQKNGYYPSHLIDITPMLPEKTVGMLDEFHLYKQEDGSVVAQASYLVHQFTPRNPQ